MPPPYPCSECKEEFESLDRLVNHLVDRHEIQRESVNVTYEVPGEQRPQSPREYAKQNPTPGPGPHEGQQIENPMRPLVENPDEASELIDTIFNRWQESKESGLKHQFRLVVVVAILFLAVLLTSSYLTQQQLLPSSAYTLLLGTIIGYLLTFLEDFL